MRHNIFDSIPSNIVSGKDNVFANFLQTAVLYKSMKIDEDNIEDLILLLDGKVRISMYCKECKEERVCNLLEYLTQRDIQTKNSGVNVGYRGKHRFFKGFNEFIKEKTRRCDNDFEKIERHVFF